MSRVLELWAGMTGTVLPYALATAPAGWLICDGAALAPGTADVLRAKLIADGSPYGTSGSNPKLPDLRGEFLRGLDGGRGIDPGRTLGSAQKGSLAPIDNTGVNQSYLMQANSDTITAPGNTALAASRLGLDADGSSYPNAQISWLNTTNNQAIDTGGFVAGQSRPRNVAVNYIIKA